MFHTIVIGVDGREGGTDALRLARRLAAPGARLIATSVALGFDDTPAAEQVVKTLTADAPDLTGEIFVAKSVADGLHETAGRHGADLIVVGSSRHGTVGRVLLGDDAAHVVRDAPCAVAVAPREYAPGDEPMTVIGVGFDRRPESLAALEVARDVAADEYASVRALHVVAVGTWVTPPNAYSGSAIDEQVRESQQAIDELENVEGDSVVGFPADDLARFSEGVDILVVGTHHRSALGRVLLGSTAEQLAGRAAAPLLVVPRPKDAAKAG